MPKNKTKVPLIEKLETLCEGLVYISEIDSEMTPFAGERVTSGSTPEILAALGRSKGETEEIEFDRFFANLTPDHDWFDDKERKQTKRFAELKEFLEENVDEARVFRFGKTRLEIYVVGTGPGGRLIGVKTKAVET